MARRRRNGPHEPEAIQPSETDGAVPEPEEEWGPEGEAGERIVPETTDGPPFRRTRIRGRLVGVAALALAVAATGLFLQDELGRRAPAAGSPSASLSGAWFCPHGGGPGQRAWVAVTNPGAYPVTVRITTFGPKGVLIRRSDVVQPSTQLYRPVPARRDGDATQVEYFGGWVGVGWILQREGAEPSLGASRCAGEPSSSWYLPDLPTASGQTSSIVIMNPFGEDAAISVTIRTDRRAAVRPGPLTPLVVPAGTSTAIGLNAFLLQAPDERVVSGEVETEIGRVVAAAVNTSTAGVATEIGVAETSAKWSLPAAGFSGPSILNLLNPLNRRSDLTVTAQNDVQQRVISGVEGLSAGPESASVYVVRDAEATGVVIESTNRSEIAVQRRVTGTRGDPALVGPAAFARTSWLLPSLLPPAGGRAMLVVQNPETVPAQVEIELLGAAGHLSAAARTLSVPAGRSTTLDLTALSGGQPASALVSASEGTIVVGGASYGAGGTGFAATLAVPVPGFL